MSTPKTVKNARRTRRDPQLTNGKWRVSLMVGVARRGIVVMVEQRTRYGWKPQGTWWVGQ